MRSAYPVIKAHKLQFRANKKVIWEGETVLQSTVTYRT